MAKLLYQGHGSLRLTTDAGTVVYIDPFAGDGYDLPADLILVTHQHYDHNAVDKPPHSSHCVIYQNSDAYCDGVYRKAKFFDLEIEAVPAYNKNHPRESCVGFLVKADGKLFYFAGDTSQTKEMASLRGREIDYAFLPGDGVYNMDVPEAAHCAEIIGAKHSVPIHLAPGKLYGEERARLFTAPGAMYVRPGEKIIL